MRSLTKNITCMKEYSECCLGKMRLRAIRFIMLSINKNKQLGKNGRIKFYMMVITSSRERRLRYCSQRYLNIRVPNDIDLHTQTYALKRRRAPVSCPFD